MEKVKFGDTIFTLAVNGINQFDDVSVTICFLPSDKKLDEIESMLENPSNTKRIEILAEDGELLQPLNDFIYLTDIRKTKDVVIDTKSIVPEVEGEETQFEEIRSDIVTVILKREDLREKLERTEQEVTELQLALAEMYERTV